ncbi:hypothetical protein EDB80DRAFT_877100 [Ilyonectria destructans]|nr:hypothetical protein EDB80DRAFT_877100 [Ilyonectria destructans]
MAPIAMSLVAEPAPVHDFINGFGGTWALAFITMCLGIWAQSFAWYAKHEDWRRADREKKTKDNQYGEMDTVKARLDAIGEDLRVAARLAAKVPGLEETIGKLRADFARLGENQKILETRLDERPKCPCEEAIIKMEKQLGSLDTAVTTLDAKFASAEKSIAAL